MDMLRNGQALSPTTAAMDVNSTIAEFVHRYQSLSVHRDTQDNLRKVHIVASCMAESVVQHLTSSQDLIVYSESVDATLRAENAKLVSRLRDTELDLEDATKSRRDLQQQVQQLEVYREAVLQDVNYLKVAPLPEDNGHC
jgi:hypothetical protein